MVAEFASALGQHARSTVLLQATQQPKYLTPMQGRSACRRRQYEDYPIDSRNSTSS
jgi:hypothetical protein